VPHADLDLFLDQCVDMFLVYMALRSTRNARYEGHPRLLSSLVVFPGYWLPLSLCPFLYVPFPMSLSLCLFPYVPIILYITVYMICT
jgi:hypothetical protein